MASTDEDWLRAFGERGYVIVPNVVPRHLLNEAEVALNLLAEREPPPKDWRGYHFYWLNDPPPFGVAP